MRKTRIRDRTNESQESGQNRTEHGNFTLDAKTYRNDDLADRELRRLDAFLKGANSPELAKEGIWEYIQSKSPTGPTYDGVHQLTPNTRRKHLQVLKSLLPGGSNHHVVKNRNLGPVLKLDVLRRMIREAGIKVWW